MRITLTSNVFISGVPAQAFQTIDVSDDDARVLVCKGKAFAAKEEPLKAEVPPVRTSTAKPKSTRKKV